MLARSVLVFAVGVLVNYRREVAQSRLYADDREPRSASDRMTMEILAHGLWAAAGAEVLRRHTQKTISTGIFCGIVLLAVLPDILQLVPILVWVAAGDGSTQALYQYMLAAPGTEPVLPPLVRFFVHHLHCIAHSAIVAGTVTLLVWLLRRQWLIPLLGWWTHIMIDVFSHSQDYYPSPVLYPITYRGFDGLAWNVPTFMVINYLLLAALYVWLLRTHKSNAS